ncbi:MAG: bifunctional (p)ppGpp synthetase/guanosine-3',5'-bis(diphosphate) 3'-pyrophosphohydrolase, partial [Gammaproteobacteria bacterium]|nr:bifunctional (p)ppGpp synthetase/guanosine-3',5'-bis(diphosphate) 3'-pyrophosphohydrolase [Gammaproteobacteria bacterium]
DAIEVEGVGNLLTETAKCCKPLPGDAVIGFITRGRGVKVHRRDCHNILNLGDGDRDRLIEVDWGGAARSRWNVDITVQAFQRQDLL